MKCWTRIALLATCLLVGIGVTGWADTTPMHIKVNGDTALANFRAVNPEDSCLESFLSVVASDVMQKLSPGGKLATVRTVLMAGVVNVCLEVTVFSGEGETPQHAFQFATDLSSATLTTTVSVFDVVSFNFYNFDVDLTWSATSAPVFHHDKEKFHDKELGIMIVSDIRGRHAPAIAVGTVVGFDLAFTSEPLDLKFTPEPSDDAELQTQNSGSIIIEKTR
jgi:hypothetical protein